MASPTRTAAACNKAASSAIIAFPRSKDGDKAILCARLARAETLYHARADKHGGPEGGINRDWAEQCRSYREDIESGDPLSYALLRHFAAGLCSFIEARS